MGIGSKLPFGLRSGKLVHISELNVEERGFKCNCNCPSCGDKLIARMVLNQHCICGQRN